MKHVKLFEEYETEVTNEGKLVRGITKGAITVGALIGRFKHLFSKEKRIGLFKDIKHVGKMVDLISFMKDSESWLTTDKLSKEDIKVLADNLAIGEKYPTVWDIFEARYELEFKRDLKEDLDAIIAALSTHYKGNDPTTMAYFKDIKEMAEAIRQTIR